MPELNWEWVSCTVTVDGGGKDHYWNSRRRWQESRTSERAGERASEDGDKSGLGNKMDH